MTLFVIQLVRIVVFVLAETSEPGSSVSNSLGYIIAIGEMFNVIIRSVHFYFFCFTENFYLARVSHQQ